MVVTPRVYRVGSMAITQRQAQNVRPGSRIKIPGAGWTDPVVSVEVSKGLAFMKIDGRRYPLVNEVTRRFQVAEPD